MKVEIIVGIAGLLVALLPVVVSFRNFKLQEKANKQQNRNFHIQQFENSFFELLRLHKEIAEAIEINGKKGKLAFKELNETIRGAYNIVQEAARKIQEEYHTQGKDPKNVFRRAKRDDFAFKLVFYGEESSELSSELDSFYHDNQLWISSCNTDLGILTPYHAALNAKFSGDNSQIPAEYRYGIRSILGPYLNHLYHTIHFVHTREFLEPEQKKFYVEILVKQISPDEEVTLFYYSISCLGEKWRELIKAYSLIKNVPFIPDFYRRSHPGRWYPGIEYANPPSYRFVGGEGFGDGDEDSNEGLWVDSNEDIWC